MMIGSVHKRIGKRGITWTAVVDDPPDTITGRRRQKRLSAPTKRELEAKLAVFRQSMLIGGIVDGGRITLREFLERWLDAVETTVRPATFRRYRDMVRRDIVPLLGGVWLEKLGPAHVQALYADRLKAGLSGTTVSNLHYLFHRALKQAVRWDLIARNVTEAVDPPRRSTPESTVWSTEQVAAFLVTTSGDEYEALWRLAPMTAMRRGEILGLRWDDVDLARGVLAVRRTLSRGAGNTWEIGAPKNAKGRRSVALPPSVVEALRRHRTMQRETRLLVGAAYRDQGYVFATALGEPLHPNSLAARFRRLSAKAGLPKIRFHDLRHTGATLMLANGEHPKIVQERLGHANISMTLDRYSHVTMDMQRAAADRLDELIDKAANQRLKV